MVINDSGIIEISIDDPIYPSQLAQISDPPELLYAIGNIKLLNNKCVALVGTRRASPYGKWVSYEIGKRIAQCGVNLVSGMAEGIDSAGHEGCLRENGNTIAVLGCGIDICFPRSNRMLYEEICKKGLVISEYAPGIRGTKFTFPRRNRIISGLSESVIVAEGAIKSGSMITAKLALEQGRDVYAVPGNINQPNSDGSNRLIADGAFPIYSLDRACEILGLSEERAVRSDELMSEKEKELFYIISQSPGINSERLAIKSDKTVVEVLGLLGGMELKGLIRKNEYGYRIC